MLFFIIVFWSIIQPRSENVEDYANSRLYTDKPLFDSPPADYIAPSQLVLMVNQGLSTPAQAEEPLEIPSRMGFRAFATPKRTTTKKPTPIPNTTASRNSTAGNSTATTPVRQQDFVDSPDLTTIGSTQLANVIRKSQAFKDRPQDQQNKLLDLIAALLAWWLVFCSVAVSPSSLFWIKIFLKANYWCFLVVGGVFSLLGCFGIQGKVRRLVNVG